MLTPQKMAQAFGAAEWHARSANNKGEAKRCELQRDALLVLVDADKMRDWDGAAEAA
jgi:hypothetical protein